MIDDGIQPNLYFGLTFSFPWIPFLFLHPPLSFNTKLRQILLICIDLSKSWICWMLDQRALNCFYNTINQVKVVSFQNNHYNHFTNVARKTSSLKHSICMNNFWSLASGRFTVRGVEWCLARSLHICIPGFPLSSSAHLTAGRCGPSSCSSCRSSCWRAWTCSRIARGTRTGPQVLLIYSL